MLDLLQRCIGWLWGNSWRFPESFSAAEWLFSAAGASILLVIGLETFWPLERRPFSRSNLLTATYFAFAGKIAVFAMVVQPLISAAWTHWHLPSLHLRNVLPPAGHAIASLLILSFGDYWAHRWLHRVPLFWHIHKIHHLPTQLNWATRYHTHFAMQIVHVPLVGVLLALTGGKLAAQFGVLLIFLDYFSHANTKLRFGWLNYLILTPETHRYHHSRNPLDHNKNYSNCFPFWDMLFGTFIYDPARPATEFGLDDAAPAGFLGQQIAPVVAIAGTVRKALSVSD